MAAVEGKSAVDRLFQRADLDRYIVAPPTEMVPEADVTALHRALADSVDIDRGATISWIAGQRTADYLLERRIPRIAQTVLCCLRPALAARILLKAIDRNSWTFAGSGRFDATLSRPIIISLTGNPITRGRHSEVPVCTYYSATFERLFRALVHADARVIETRCEAMGAPDCRFTVTWPGRRAGVVPLSWSPRGNDARPPASRSKRTFASRPRSSGAY